MRTIKLFEDWHSDLPQTMKMEDIKKLSPEDFLKLGEETLERGKGTDQNEFWTIFKTWYKENFEKSGYDDWSDFSLSLGSDFITKLGHLMDDYGLESDFDDILPPVMGDKRKEKLDKEIERVESYIKNIKERPDRIEDWYKSEINRLDQKKKYGMDIAMRELKKLPELEKELAKLKSERENFKF